VKRVEDVIFLRTHQFAEDAGPMAHPVRPDAFVDISNFYTLTVYEKGAEVVRMLHTLLGHEQFIAGARLYFQRFDGQAVTCDDFVDCMAEISGRDLTQFRRWYEQAGTPELIASGQFDAEAKQYHLTLKQRNRPTPGQTEKPPLAIPVATGLIVDGEPVALDNGTTRILELTEPEQTFTFDCVTAPPVPSLLRGFSAPVRLTIDYSEADLLTLMSADDDAFVAWDAAQTLLAQAIETLDLTQPAANLDSALLEAVTRVLSGPMDAAMKALTLCLPSEEYLADRAAQRGLVDMTDIHLRRQAAKRLLGRSLEAQWRQVASSAIAASPYRASASDIGLRSLRHLALDYLLAAQAEDLETAEHLLHSADNLTDRLAALRWITQYADAARRGQTLAAFYDRWQQESLIVNQWFTVQATRPDTSCVESVRELLDHCAFDWRNPNKLRALVGAFAGANPVAFHRADGAGYQLLGDVIARIQASNPQIAARMLAPLTRWRRYAVGQELMRAELERIAAIDPLPKDVFEVVSRSLAATD
jgi:aminopeptidase N